DAETLRYLELTGRTREQIALVESYCKEQGLFHTSSSPDPMFTERLELDLSTVEPSLAGPKRPQDRVPLHSSKESFGKALASFLESRPGGKGTSSLHAGDGDGQLAHGSVVIAAITSCTNTSNPSVMLAAGLLAKKAVERGLTTKPWVKASLAPGSQVVTEYLRDSGLNTYLDR